MASACVAPAALKLTNLDSVERYVGSAIDDLMSSLPDPGSLTTAHRRAIVARYTSVLEGNFIYWMTGAYLAAGTEQARSIILENLREEIRDSHPLMLRRFAIAAGAVPGEGDADVVYRHLTSVRLFVGQLCAVRLLVMMAFFEGFIQRFMGFLAELAKLQGSTEMEYTDVHGVCDIAHTAGLFRALDAEMTLKPPDPAADIFEGVEVLGALIQTIVHQQ